MESRSKNTPLLPVLLLGGLAIVVWVIIWPMLNGGAPKPEAQPTTFGGVTMPVAATPIPAPSEPASTGDPGQESQIALVMAQQNRVQDAIAHYHEAVRLYRAQLTQTPDAPPILNNLAWILATNPNDEIREPKEAVILAQHAVQLTGRKQAIFLGTLAAAYASAGDFMEASDTATEAEKVALAAGDKDLATKNEQLLQSYQAGKPYRDPY